jgi:hypothetical protein
MGCGPESAGEKDKGWRAAAQQDPFRYIDQHRPATTAKSEQNAQLRHAVAASLS